MRRRFHRHLLDLHLYLGLFCTPFVLVFSVSVFFLVHAWLPHFGSLVTVTREVPALHFPDDFRKLSGRAQIDALKPVLESAGVHGEIGFIRHRVAEDELVIPVTVPGRETIVTISLRNRNASIAIREAGLAAGMAMLHRSPGEHAPAIRMNWAFMKAWRWLADTTAYLLFFLTLSGIYLWYVLKAERMVGLILLGAGGLTLFGLAYALSS